MPRTATVGTYAITPTNALSNGAFSPSNYTINYVNGSISVVPVSLTLTANNHGPKNYGDLVSSAGTEFSTVGLVNSETVGSVTLTSAGAPRTAAVGTYAIAPSSATGGTFNPANYTINYVNGSISVVPVSLTLTANNHAPKPFGAVVTFAGTEFSSLGLVNSETVGSVTLTSAGAPAPAPVGTYAIVASNAIGGTFAPSNYTITYVDGSMTVVPVTSPPVIIPPLINPPVVLLPPGVMSSETTPDDTPIVLAEAAVDWPVQTPLDIGSRSAMGDGGSHFALVGEGVLMPPLAEAPLTTPEMAPPVQLVPSAPKPQAPLERPRKQDRF